MPPNPWLLYPSFLDPAQADRYFAIFLDELTWEQRAIKMYGRMMQEPRQVAWYGDPEALYTYSGVVNVPRPWHPLLLEIKELIESAISDLIPNQPTFNSVLCNLYRDGRDSMGWHSDDEKELGANPIIASLSLGVPRDFRLRRRAKQSNGKKQNNGENHKACVTLSLSHGSLLLMLAGCQSEWQHSLPKRLRVNSPRINLTFRRIISQQT